MAAIVEQELPKPTYSDFPSVELCVKITGLGCNTMIERFSIFTHATFLELLKIILSKHMKYGDSSFRVSSHNLSINIENAMKKVKDYYEEDYLELKNLLSEVGCELLEICLQLEKF